MGQNQPLPVPGQHILRTLGIQYHAAARGARFQPQMHVGKMAQRLIMANALHRLENGFLIQDGAGAKGDLQPIALGDQPFQHLLVHLAHELGVDLPVCLVPA